MDKVELQQKEPSLHSAKISCEKLKKIMKYENELNRLCNINSEIFENIKTECK